MELGRRLKEARLAAGLSQRQLCGEVITRNMLSQIENGTARPSMDTLRYLAGRLQKPVSYFLEEAAPSPREQRLLARLDLLDRAETALKQGRSRYAEDLLAEMEWEPGELCREYLSRRRLLLLGRANSKNLPEICKELPSLDEELLLRGKCALEQGELDRAAALLDAAEDRESPEWNFLRGEAYLARQAYAPAAECFHRAEAQREGECAPRLELCYRELGDYRQAYFYACKQRR